MHTVWDTAAITMAATIRMVVTTTLEGTILTTIGTATTTTGGAEFPGLTRASVKHRTERGSAGCYSQLE